MEVICTFCNCFNFDSYFSDLYIYCIYTRTAVLSYCRTVDLYHYLKYFRQYFRQYLLKDLCSDSAKASQRRRARKDAARARRF